MTPEERKHYIDNALARGAKMMPDCIMQIANCFCGCGSPEDAWTWVRDYLAMTASERHWYDAKTGPDWIAIYLMDHLDLTEHGSGVRGAWITDKGREVLAFLNEHGVDWDEKGEWIDSDGVSHGM